MVSYSEGRRLWVFKNEVQRKVYGPKGDELKATGEIHLMRSFITCTFYQILLG
jgi:hypothetical protein